MYSAGNNEHYLYHLLHYKEFRNIGLAARFSAQFSAKGGIGKNKFNCKNKPYDVSKRGVSLMRKNTLKRISTLLMACMLMGSMAIPASAGNVSDTRYYKENVTAGTWISSLSRYKEDSSKVYVYPSKPVNGKTWVKTYCRVGGVGTNKTYRTAGVLLTSGSEYVITNYVYEDGDYTTGKGVAMWLRMTPYSGTGNLEGVWSPDWSGHGTGITIV